MSRTKAYIPSDPIVSVNPANPISGWHKLFRKDDGYVYSQDDAGVLTNLNLYGSKSSQENSIGRTTTTSSTYQTKTSLSTGTVDTSYIYRLDFSCVLDSTAANRNINFRIYNSTNATVLYEAVDIRVTNTNSRVPTSGFVEITFGSTEARTIQMQWNSDNNSTAIGIAYAYLNFYRVR